MWSYRGLIEVIAAIKQRITKRVAQLLSRDSKIHQTQWIYSANVFYTYYSFVMDTDSTSKPYSFPKGRFRLEPIQFGSRNRCNESHHFCRYPDEVVARVRTLHARGLRNCEISRVTSIDKRRVSEWLGQYPHRRAPPRYIGIRRVVVNGWTHPYQRTLA